ncbi:Phospholipase_D-nuclease N-terminal [Desulfonatronum thiosulfatophilum]|uniref:Phospholipase_D-nuclease N-terminal n=2 Tax=Desulfonatronum thiosulfatophilum TaxID=617002 RepID=A0A1G6EM06_9BACT|nr:PLD nuclease N-terminal domain-containing protein [Desulfonatronum thiosulfatophilum]SDB58414.1 Phospholipase_D-nuclease N-terminal [Desulfonatronum thiosulfatophilum]
MFDLPPSQLILIMALLALPILPNLWAIWHSFHADFTTHQEKMVWIAVCVFVPVLGGLAYLIWGRKRARRDQ